MIFNHIKQLDAEGKKIGITFSTFDMLHAGHIAMLSEAKMSERRIMSDGLMSMTFAEGWNRDQKRNLRAGVLRA
jgi:nicotinic acid mononucleotide adenylyltransferase